jgi:hypothetical protein
MLYIDTPFEVDRNHPTAPSCFRGKLSAHLTADTREELMVYVVTVGMKPNWKQKWDTPYFHFDVTGSRLQKILKDDRVMKIGAKDMAKLFLARTKK